MAIFFSQFLLGALATPAAHACMRTQTYNLDKDFKINIEPNHTTLAGHSAEHDIVIAGQYGALGSIDANTGERGGAGGGGIGWGWG